MSMKYRTYKELEDKSPAVTQDDLDAAMQAFLSSGGTVQSLDSNDKEFRKQQKAVTTKNVRFK